MGRYLTAHGFANAPALLGEVSRIDARGTTPCAGRRPGLRAQPGRCLDLGPQSGQPRLRRHGEPRGLGRVARRRHQGLSRPRRQRSAASSAPCTSCWRGRPTIRPSRRARPAARTSRPGSSGRSELVSRAFDAIAMRTDWDNEAVEADAHALLANREALERGAAPAGRARRRHADDAHPWRFPPRPGAGRQRRCLHHRLRGRAGAAARRTPRQGQPAGATSPACCAPSTMRRRRRSIPRTWSQAACRRDGASGWSRACARARRRPSSTAIARPPAAGQTGQPTLLDFFLIEKAAYEVNYEAANRPTWLAIPVGGLARIASRLLASAPERQS